MIRRSVILRGGIAAIMILAAGASGTEADGGAAPATRPFHMGLLEWSFGTTPEDGQKLLELLSKHSDLRSIQFNDGVPWPEAYAGQPYHPNFEKVIQERISGLDPKQKRYVEVAALNMGRNDYALYRGESGQMPLPAPWDGYAPDSEQKITAYANFCNDIATRLKPDYMNYGLESADLAHSKPEDWDAFVRFHAEVYKRIKEQHPDLPLGISVPLKHPDSGQAQLLRKTVPEILPYVDFVAATIYPTVLFGHAGAGDPAKLPEKWLSQIAEIAPGKPLAVSEANWAAEDIDVDQYNIHVKCSAEWQRDYVAKLLPEVARLNALFVVWWPIADWDEVWETLPGDVKEFGKLWRDTGLYNEKLQPRPALEVWEKWLKMPVER